MSENQTIAFARSQLAYYLTLMGVVEPPKLIVQLTDAIDGLGIVEDCKLEDAFVINASNTLVTITATNPRSVLLSIYRLLHELGCRFLGPTPQDELIPQAPKQIEITLCERASYRHRGVCIEGADSLENILDFIAWCPKVGFNSFFVQFREPNIFLQRWYDHVNNPTMEPEQHDAAWMEAACRKIDEAIATRGLLHHRVGHGWTAEVIGGKDGWEREESQVAPDSEAMLAMINGKRELVGGIATNTNLCCGNKAASSALINVIVDYALQHREVDFLHVWLADEYNNLCECEGCRNTMLADQYIEILNEIDRELTKRECDSKLVLLLYQELLWPPQHTQLNNPNRFLLMFAPISRTFMTSYADTTDIPQIKTYQRNNIELPKTLEENLSFLREWQKADELDSFVYDYPLGRAHYGDLGYLHISRIISHDVHALRQLGLNGYISCQELRAALPNSLPNYVMGRTLWNDELTFEALTQEYFNAAYGDAATEVFDYLERISKLSNCDYFNNKMPRLQSELVEQFAAITELASHRMPSDTTGNELQVLYKQRLSYHRDYCVKLADTLAALAAGDDERRERCWCEFARFIRTNETEHQPLLDVYRVIEVATNYTGCAGKR